MHGRKNIKLYTNNLQRIGIYMIFGVFTAMATGVRVLWNVLPLFR